MILLPQTPPVLQWHPQCLPGVPIQLSWYRSQLIQAAISLWYVVNMLCYVNWLVIICLKMLWYVVWYDISIYFNWIFNTYKKHFPTRQPKSHSAVAKKKNCVQSASVAWVISKDAFSSQDRLNMAWHASWNLWEIYEICLRKLWHYENMFESSGMEDSQDNIIIYHASYLGLSATSDTSTSAICNQISACRSPSAVQCV